MHNSIPKLLQRIRRRIRLYILAKAGLAVAIALVVLFWIGLALDWWLEPSRGVRIIAWSLVGGGLAALLYRFGWSRLRHPISDANVALLVERAHPKLHDRLLTAVAPVRSTGSEAFLEMSARQASTLVEDFSPASVVTLKSLGRVSVLALMLVATVIGFACWQREAFATWIDRLALSEVQWPRRVDLIVEGFEPDDRGRLVRSVPKFESTEIVVRANLAGKYEAPDELEILFRTPGKRLERGLFARVGSAEKGRDDAQVYRYQFAELSEPLELEVRGGDDRVRNLWIEVLPRPRIVELSIEANYPEYLAMPTRRLSATSLVTVPMGTKLSISGLASQPISQVEAMVSIEGLAPPIVQVDAVDSRKFQVSLPALPNAGEISLIPIDKGGVKAREPYVLTLVAQGDEVPTTMLQLAGIGTAVTPEALLPMQVRAEDDHAIHRLWVDLLVDGQLVRTQPVEFGKPQSALDSRSEVDLASLTVAESESKFLQPGQRLTLAAKAEDGWNLSEESRIGSSRTILLDVVTSNQLLEQLEREEINLRRTFERVIEKTIQSGEKLASISFAESPMSEAEGQQLGRIQLARVVDDVHQVAAESLGVATGFQLIHDQLVNNRVGDQELKSRLQERIAEPLRQIVERDLRPLGESIEATGRMSKPSARDTAALAGRTAEVVDRMRSVLAEMKALETYSEVVGMLRKLIQEQETLTDRTRKTQRNQLQTLLEEE